MKHAAPTAALGCLFVLSLQFSAAAEMVVQTCFSPQGKCSAHILREIGSAKQELLVAVYAFTSDDLATALVIAKKRGVAVQVIVDREFDRTNDNSKGKFLEGQKIPVRRLSGASAKAGDKDPGVMHQKFAVIDRRIVLTGSYNWTPSAENRNDENLLMFRDASPLAEEYRKSFLRLWERKP
ncbi:MAG TPA: phospholipase D family protein [Candidatus Binatia bacterium]|nr:phospholipase D family protein [Candidatus Binatia bacterium]